MKKMKKLIIGAIFAGLSMLTLTGCRGYDKTLTFKQNDFLSPIYTSKSGYSRDIDKNDKEGESFYLNNKSYKLGSVQNENLYDKGSIINDYDFLFNYNDYQYGKISADYATDKNGFDVLLRDRVYDLGINIEIFEGCTLEDIWNENIWNIQDRWDAQAVYEQYKNGTQAERDAIIKKWRPEYMLTINFDAPVVCEYGQEYVTINGNQAVVNVGDMLADNGGYVRLNSSKINKDGVVAPIPNSVIDKYINKPVMGFNDVKEKDWFAKSVEYAVTNKTMTGYGNGKFGPNDNVTFAQLAKIMANAGMNSTSSYESLNLDHWANDAVSWCIDKGLFIQSDLQENGSYSVGRLDAPMTREQAIYSMSKFASVIKNQTPNGKETSIPDIMSVNEKYRDEIKLAYQYGITSGTDKNNTFSPEKMVKRAEVCQMFYNMKW